MAMTSVTISRVGPSSFRLDWAGDDPDATFYVYRDGALVAETTQTSMQFAVPAGDAPVFEVLDDAGDDASPVYPAYATLSWADVDGAAEYRVQQYVSGVWTTRTTVTDDGRGYYRWQSRALADSASHQFRVIPVGENGNDGTASTFAIFIARHPDPPTAAYAYSAGTSKVTVAVS